MEQLIDRIIVDLVTLKCQLQQSHISTLREEPDPRDTTTIRVHPPRQDIPVRTAPLNRRSEEEERKRLLQEWQSKHRDPEAVPVTE